jgi:Protein of unknown function (DUF2795)
MANISPVEVEKSLKGVNFPAKKQDLIRHARQQNVGQPVIEALSHLPEQTFDGPIEVTKAIGDLDRK